MLDRFLKAIKRIARVMTQVSGEERVKLLAELDRVVAEIKSLMHSIADISQKLHFITKMMDDDIADHGYRSRGPFSKELDAPNWQPSEINLSELKNQHTRLRELINKRDELQRQLGITIT
jgi:hypothetical protein